MKLETGSKALKWIPWKRYVLLLGIDGKKIIELGRFRRREGADKLAVNLKMYKGYVPEVIDTKQLGAK